MRANPFFPALLLLAGIAAIPTSARAAHTCDTAEAVAGTASDVDAVSVLTTDRWYAHTTATGLASYALQPSSGSDVDLAVYDAACATLLCRSSAPAALPERCAVAGDAGATFRVRVTYWSGTGGYEIAFRPDCQISSGVAFCLAHASEIASFPVATVEPDGASHEVAGYLDLYRLELPEGRSLTYSCVTLEVDGGPVSCPGSLFQRGPILLKETRDVPGSGDPVSRVRVCAAVLVVEAAGRSADVRGFATACEGQ